MGLHNAFAFGDVHIYGQWTNLWTMVNKVQEWCSIAIGAQTIQTSGGITVT